MFEKKTSHIGILCCLILTTFSEPVLFPANHEITFLWNATSSVGSSIPVKLSSQFNFFAELVIQTLKNSTLLELRNIVGDGELRRGLELPWQAVYNNGALVGLATVYGDEEWSVNVKRALTSIFQLDLASLRAGSLAFVSQETGIYGSCRVEYIVQDHHNVKQVKKILDLQSCKNHPTRFWSKNMKFLCPNSYQSEVISHCEREYFIDLDSPATLLNISATGSSILQPYQSQAEAHHSLVSQTLVLKSAVPIAKEITLPGPSNFTDLYYKELILDATHGQPPSNKTHVVQEVTDLLDELSNSLSWEVSPRGIDNETVFMLVDLMRWLELPEWEQLYQTLTLGTSYQQETMQHLFWELVPEIGSPASALFIRDLVKSERIKGSLAERLLISFPFYQRDPTEGLLEQCEELFHLTSPIGKDVRSSAILGFATLIHKTCAHKCSADTTDRYAKLYLDQFKESTDYEDRMLHLQGLSNLELRQGLDYLAPIIVGQPPADHHIQFLAIWAVLNNAQFNPNKVFELFWPLLSNRSQTLEIRVAAMTMLLMKPSPERLISIFWFMQSEPCLQLYNFYYTTIKSMASTTYPCYSQLGTVASQIARFVQKRSSVWATGNYILDYEDKERGYGGLLQIVSIGSERTGLPNVFIFMAEQHSLGVTTSYALYIKLQGVGDEIKRQLYNMTISTSINFQKIAELLKTLKAPVKSQEEIHLEFIFKVDGKTVITQYFNSSTFRNISLVVKRLSSVYMGFSVNYQRLSSPLVLSRSQPTDLGLPSLVEIRSNVLVSTRGSVSQDDQGRARKAQLDLRYSWMGITSLKIYIPMVNKWYGATRSRSLHVRLPFAVQLHLDVVKKYFKIKSIHHKDYMSGSHLGMVWHAVTKLIPHDLSENQSYTVKEEWRMDSQDLGARLGASLFDCSGKYTVSNSLHLLKKAFLTKEKNYQMLPGGVLFLGIFSLKEQLSFQPPGSNCGLMLYFTPLLSQVEPVLTLDKNQLKLQMMRKDGLLWEIQAELKKTLDHNRELTFKLYHTPSVSATTAEDIWRVILLEGAFVLPSSKASVFNPPAPMSGYTSISWGDSSPTQADKAAVKVVTSPSENQTLKCSDLSPKCLQFLSEMATQQVADVQYVNLPGWLLTAAHALFPEHVQTGSSSTRIGFTSPASLPPWNTQGLCAVNTDSVLTMDNYTTELSLTTCYTMLVADCSQDSTFAVLVKKMSDPQHLALKLYAEGNVIELLPATNGSIDVFINENIKINPIKEDYEHEGTIETAPYFSISVKQGAVEVELYSGVIVQHYSQTVVALVPGVLRGYTCGLCGDFNSDTESEPVTYYTQC